MPSGRIMRSSSGDSLLGQYASDGDSASAMFGADGTCMAAAAAVMALLHKRLQFEAAAAAVKISGGTDAWRLRLRLLAGKHVHQDSRVQLTPWWWRFSWGRRKVRRALQE